MASSILWTSAIKQNYCMNLANNIALFIRPSLDGTYYGMVLFVFLFLISAAMG